MVRATNGHIAGGRRYAWIIRDALDLRYDIQQGTCDADDLPAEVRGAADALLGHAFSYVDWPR